VEGGAKAVVPFTDNSKRSQPLNAGGKKEEKKAETAVIVEQHNASSSRGKQAQKMPVERASVTHKFSVGGQKAILPSGFMTTGGRRSVHQDGEGRVNAIGVMDGLALTISLACSTASIEGIRGQAAEHKVRTFRYHANPNINFVIRVGLHCAVVGRPVHFGGLFEAEHAAPAENAATAARQRCFGDDGRPIWMRCNGAVASRLSNAHEGAPTCSECGMLMVPTALATNAILRQHERMQ